jgi:hypothetical protein
MATWSDIERAMDKLEDLDKTTLEAFARVMPAASDNPTYRHRFDLAQQRIRRRLDQIEAEATRSSQKGSNDHSDDHWYKKPVGIIFLSVAAGLLLLLIKLFFGL